MIDSNITLNEGINTYNIKAKGNFKEAYIIVRFIDSSEDSIYFPDLSLNYSFTIFNFRGQAAGTIVGNNTGDGNIIFNVTIPDVDGQIIKYVYAK